MEKKRIEVTPFGLEHFGGKRGVLKLRDGDEDE
jgi:hypothetical protein